MFFFVWQCDPHHPSNSSISLCFRCHLAVNKAKYGIPPTIGSESNKSTRYNATKIFFCGLQHYADGDKKPLQVYM
jgi:hypothetical protein